MYFNILYNHAFVFANHVLRHKRGLAIGGPCSLQLASRKCMLSEHRFYPVYAPFAPMGALAIHPSTCLLPTKPGRFRDNINGIMFSPPFRDLLQASFDAVHNLDLQWEGGGDQWITLQGEMTLEPQNPLQPPPHIRPRVADRSLKHTVAHQFPRRYSDAHAPKTRNTLKSLVSPLVKNFGHQET